MDWKTVTLVKRIVTYPFRLLFFPIAFLVSALMTDFDNEYERDFFFRFIEIFYKF